MSNENSIERRHYFTIYWDSREGWKVDDYAEVAIVAGNDAVTLGDDITPQDTERDTALVNILLSTLPLLPNPSV